MHKTENQPYIYPLKTQKRKYIKISKNDPRNTASGLAKLRSFYENVYVVDDAELFNHTEFLPNDLTTVQNFSLESISAGNVSTNTSVNVTGVTSSSSPVLTPPPSTAFKPSLLPPVNLTVVPVNVYATNGSHTVSLNVSFDSYLAGATADDYEIIITDQAIQHPGAINNITKSTNTLTWNVVTSATNYIIEGTKVSDSTKIAPILVLAPAAGTTTVSYTMSGLSGNYNITVTPYNNMGIAGTSVTKSLTF